MGTSVIDVFKHHPCDARIIFKNQSAEGTVIDLNCKNVQILVYNGLI